MHSLQRNQSHSLNHLLKLQMLVSTAYTLLSKDKSFEELKEEGIREAESGNIGKALNLLSHAASLNDKDYKTFEMIAQVAFFLFLLRSFTSCSLDPSEL